MSAKPATVSRRNPAATREKLVLATVNLILKQGFTGAGVDQICAEAGVTKGSFFHHFENKEAIGLAAADWWGAMGTALYAEAWAQPDLDPLEQLDRFFEIMIGFTTREEPCTCVVGILSQELALANPALRAACARHLDDWTHNCARMLAAAKAKYPPVVDFDPVEVAWYLNSLWQGSMLTGKTRQHPEMIRCNLRMARTWLAGFFGLPHSPLQKESHPNLPNP